MAIYEVIGYNGYQYICRNDEITFALSKSVLP